MWALPWPWMPQTPARMTSLAPRTRPADLVPAMGTAAAFRKVRRGGGGEGGGARRGRVRWDMVGTLDGGVAGGLAVLDLNRRRAVGQAESGRVSAGEWPRPCGAG